MKNDQDEILVIVNGEDQVVGFKTREEFQKDETLICRVVAVFVINDQGKILLQKRSRNKHTYPGFYTLSATGHVEKDESYEAAIHRELKEELGIDGKLEYFFKTIVYPDNLGNETEMAAFFKYHDNGPFVIAKDEIEYVKFFSVEELVKLDKTGKIRLTPLAKVGIKQIMSR